jgi:hypothetical protein
MSATIAAVSSSNDGLRKLGRSLDWTDQSWGCKAPSAADEQDLARRVTGLIRQEIGDRCGHFGRGCQFDQGEWKAPATFCGHYPGDCCG